VARLVSLLTLAAVLGSCTIGGSSSSATNGRTTPTPSTSAQPSGGAAASASPTPDPNLPIFAIENLRTHAYPGGQIQVGAQMARGAGYTKSHMSWPSQGQTMTGTISMPDGPGPFPVVIVNHGHIPTSRYWIGQDSGIFGDPMASHGFISLAPNYPGYSGSGTLDPAYPSVIGEAVADIDMVSSLASLPQADTSRVAMIGHSNGGGVSLLISVIDKRVKAFALFAPISSDMADNARKWWNASDSRGGAPPPDAAPQIYAHISPRNYFTPSTPPMLFLQGTADQDIPADWTNATLAALQAKGVATSVQWYPGAQHDFGGSVLADADARAEAWIRQHI
jgi:dipeptidyl aminopeptidase/acylaminoacyl peptidase